MDLLTFVHSSKIKFTWLANELNISRPHLSAVASKRYKPSVKLADDIVSFTRGLVTKEELFEGFTTKTEKECLEEFFKKHNVA